MRLLLEQHLRVHVEKLASETGERNVQQPKALYAAAGFIRDTWGQLGFAVHAQGHDTDGVWSENLAIEIAGSTQTKEIILFGALLAPNKNVRFLPSRNTLFEHSHNVF